MFLFPTPFSRILVVAKHLIHGKNYPAGAVDMCRGQWIVSNGGQRDESVRGERIGEPSKSDCFPTII